MKQSGTIVRSPTAKGKGLDSLKIAYANKNPRCFQRGFGNFVADARLFRRQHHGHHTPFGFGHLFDLGQLFELVAHADKHLQA